MCSFIFNGEEIADFNRCFDNYLLFFAPLTKYFIVVVKYNG